jgi:hypothetical protein
MFLAIEKLELLKIFRVFSVDLAVAGIGAGRRQCTRDSLRLFTA